MTRDYYFDFIRGVAIIMVVAIHCYPSHIRFSDGDIEILEITIRNIFNCAVPLFLAISGYFISQRVNENPNFNWREFWKKQVPKVYIPCLIFSIPWLVLDIYNGVSPLRGILISLLCGMSVYYFILLIICCYFLSPVMMKFRNPILLIITFILSLLSVVACFVINSLRGGYLPLIIQGSILSFGFFFALGIVLGREKLKYSLKWPVLIALMGFLISLAETYFWQVNYDVTGVGQKASALIFNTGIIFLCFCPDIRKSYRETKFQRIIRWIGDISFGIYFTHVLLIFLFRRLASGLMESWVISTLLTLSTTIFIIIICKKMAPEFANKYLGFR